MSGNSVQADASQEDWEKIKILSELRRRTELGETNLAI